MSVSLILNLFGCTLIVFSLFIKKSTERDVLFIIGAAIQSTGLFLGKTTAEEVAGVIISLFGLIVLFTLIARLRKAWKSVEEKLQEK